MPDGTEQQKTFDRRILPNGSRRNIRARMMTSTTPILSSAGYQESGLCGSVDLPQDFKLLRTSTGYKNLDDLYEQAGRSA
jgi:hypothetical protein